MQNHFEISRQIESYVDRFLQSQFPRIPHLRTPFLLNFIRKHRLEGYFEGLNKNHTEPSNIIAHYVGKAIPHIRARQKRLVSHFLTMQRELKQLGVSVVPIKGLALTLEPEWHDFPRLFNDLDLIIENDTARLTLDYLMRHGFADKGNNNLETQLKILTGLGSLNLINIHKNINFDLHLNGGWCYFPGYISFEDILTHAPSNLGLLSEYLPPDRVMHILVLLYAGTKDRWNRISSIVDITLALKQLNSEELARLDWEIKSRNIERFMAVFIQLQSIVLPEFSHRDFTFYSGLSHIDRITQCISRGWTAIDTKDFNKEYKKISDHLKLLGTTRSRIRYLTTRVFVCGDADYRFSSEMLCMLVRLIRLIRKCSKEIKTVALERWPQYVRRT